MTDLVERLRSFHYANFAYNAAQEAADRIEALEAALVDERERCIAICESWIGTFQGDASEDAVEAIEDIIKVIREGGDPRLAQPPRTRCIE